MLPLQTGAARAASRSRDRKTHRDANPEIDKPPLTTPSGTSVLKVRPGGETTQIVYGPRLLSANLECG